LRYAPHGKAGAYPGRCAGARRRNAAHLPSAAADRLLLQSVPVLPELQRRGHCVPDVVAPNSAGAVAVPARTLPLRSVGYPRFLAPQCTADAYVRAGLSVPQTAVTSYLRARSFSYAEITSFVMSVAPVVYSRGAS